MDFIDAKALRHFLTVVRHGSFRAAAEQLNVAPSAVSRQIADLEYEIGLPLFERTARGATLTPAGSLLLEHGRRLTEEGGLLAEELDRLKGGEQRRVAIVCGEGFVGDLIDNGLASFFTVYPHVRHALQLAGTDAIVDTIANGEADIGLVYNPPVETRIRSIAIKRQPLCMVTRTDDALLNAGRSDLASGLHRPLALLTEGHGTRQLVARMAADAGLAIAPVLETQSIDALRRFAMAGGVTFLPHFAVANEIAAGLLGASELDDPLALQASAHLIVRAHRRLPASVDNLASHLSQNMAAFRL